MFGSLGMPELLFILLLALLVFGPKRLPQVGKTLGRGLREFRRATNELKRTVETEISTAEMEAKRPTPVAEPLSPTPGAQPEPQPEPRPQAESPRRPAPDPEPEPEPEPEERSAPDPEPASDSDSDAEAEPVGKE